MNKINPVSTKSNPKNLDNRWFQVILNYKFRHPDIDQSIAETASKMNISENTLAKYVNGNNIMPPERIPELVIATGDVEFFCELLRPAGYFPVKIDYEKFGKGLSASDYLIEAFLELSKAIEIIKETSPNDFTVHKYKKLHSILNSILSLIYNWDEKFKRMAKP